MYPKTIVNLIECFKFLPGIGERSAERLSFALLNMEKDQIDYFSDSIKEINEKITRCECCNNISDTNKCIICENNSRDNHVLCIVEDPKSVFLFEKIGNFKGHYHVLDGLISPLDGINPEDIGIDKLLKRIENNNFNEIVIAVKPSIEGETTSLYIKRILDGSNILVTKLASGVPNNADIEYIDVITLERAFSDRKNVE